MLIERKGCDLLFESVRKVDDASGIAEDRGREFPSLPLSRSNLSGLEKAHETIVYHNICARLRH